MASLLVPLDCVKPCGDVQMSKFLDIELLARMAKRGEMKNPSQAKDGVYVLVAGGVAYKSRGVWFSVMGPGPRAITWPVKWYMDIPGDLERDA